MSTADTTTAEAAIAEAAPEIIEGLNSGFADSTLLVAQVLGGHPDATAARITALSTRGAELVVVGPGGEAPLELLFDEEVTDLDSLRMALFGLVGRARELAGDDVGLTTAELQLAELSEFRTLLTEVVAVEDVHPHLRRITVSGDDLTGLRLPGPDTFFYVLLPPPGRTELTIDQSFTWDGYGTMPEDERPVGAYYTVRRWDPATNRIEMLFVLHDDVPEGGHASRWAGKAAVGDPVALWGPRTAYEPPEGTAHQLLVADETGLPAVAAILEWLPPEVTVQVVAEVADAASRQELPDRPGTEVVWCHRDGAEPGTTTLLLDAVRALPPLPPATYVWGGGESRTLTKVRRHVRDDRGLDRESVGLIAYWRREG